MRVPPSDRRTCDRRTRTAQPLRVFVCLRGDFAALPTGTPVAISGAMAAVFALVFLFVIASIGGMLKALPAANFGTIVAMLAFGSLAVGVFLGLFKLARGWENEVPTGE